MKKWTNVTIEWEDGKITTESFRSEEEFYDYKDDTESDWMIMVKWESDNWNWTF
jgi:hypothetical protein